MNTTQTIDYTLDKLEPVFAKLESLGIHAWEVAVRQQVIEGASALLLLVPVLAASAVVLVKTLHSASVDESEHPWGEYGPNSRFWVALCGGIIFMAALVAVVASGTGWLGHILNPEWYAMEALAGMVQ